MILQALHELAESEKLLEDPDYERKPITYLLSLGRDGRFAKWCSTLYEPESGGKRKPKPVAKTWLVPREAARTSGARAFFFYDKAEYVFGLDPDGKRSGKKLEERAALFRERVDACADATGDEGAVAVRRFLHDVAAGRVEEAELLPEGCTSNALFTFELADEEGLVFERPAIRHYWKQLRREQVASSEPRPCLVTGKPGVPASLHPQVKLPGGSTSGVPLVSFNARAFESYGWSKNENASVSQEAAESYATALATLLDVSPKSASGEALSRRNLRLSGDTVVCFWSRNQALAGSFFDFLTVKPEQVAESYRSIWRGVAPPELADASAFYALTLTGTQGRAITRGWFRSTAAEVVRAVALYFRDLDLVRLTPPPKKGGHPPAHALPRLLQSLAPLGKSDQVPASLGQAVFEAAITDRPLPLSLLQRALLRVRAEATRDEWSDRDRRDSRHALIKAVLERRRRHGHNLTIYPELRPVLDADNTNPGYLLGRLMAVIEKLQQLALGDINASVVDRFFGAAMATPRAVFVRLARGARHHARKAKDDEKKKGYAIHLERELDSLYDRFDVGQGGLPGHLNLEEQGLFVIGYHQQRHAFFTKKNTAPAEIATEIDNPAAESAA